MMCFFFEKKNTSFNMAINDICYVITYVGNDLLATIFFLCCYYLLINNSLVAISLVRSLLLTLYSVSFDTCAVNNKRKSKSHAGAHRHIYPPPHMPHVSSSSLLLTCERISCWCTYFHAARSSSTPPSTFTLGSSEEEDTCGI